MPSATLPKVTTTGIALLEHEVGKWSADSSSPLSCALCLPQSALGLAATDGALHAQTVPLPERLSNEKGLQVGQNPPPHHG